MLSRNSNAEEDDPAVLGRMSTQGGAFAEPYPIGGAVYNTAKRLE